MASLGQKSSALGPLRRPLRAGVVTAGKTGRNPTTGAPVHIPGQPEVPFGHLPPGPHPTIQANGRHPITGTLLFFRPG